MRNFCRPLPVIGALFLGAATAPAATLTGLWQFNNGGNLGQATVGTNLTINGTAPAFSASMADDVANSQSGVITTVLGPTNSYTATHGIPANGGGAFVNEYSILVDLFSPAGSRGSWRTIFQTNTANTNDGDYFIRNDTDLLGTASLTYTTNPIPEGQWQRLVITYDLEPVATNSVIRAYLNGNLFYTHASASTELQRDGRFSLDPTILFFADNDGDNASLNVGNLAIWNGALTGPEVASLGVAGAPIPEPGSAALLALAAGAVVTFRRKTLNA